MPLSQFLDGETIDCAGVKAERCDNCIAAAAHWKSEDPSTGLQLFQAQVRHHARGLDQMEQVLNEIRDDSHSYCPPCWLLDGVETADHSFFHCRRREGLSFLDCVQFTSKIKCKDRYLSCWKGGKCLVTQTLCLGFQPEGSCRW